MSFLKFFGLGVIGLLLITLPAIYFISGSLNLETALRVAIPFIIALAIIYFIESKRKKGFTK